MKIFLLMTLTLIMQNSIASEIKCFYEGGKLAIDVHVEDREMTKSCLDRGACPFEGKWWPKLGNSSYEISGKTSDSMFRSNPEIFGEGDYLFEGIGVQEGKKLPILSVVSKREFIALYVGKNKIVFGALNLSKSSIEKSGEESVFCSL